MRDGFELVGIALEHGGRDAAMPFVDAAAATFPNVADEHGRLSRLFDFKVVPNGVLVDVDGTVRWAKFGGFSIERPDDVQAVEAFLAGRDPGQSPEMPGRYTLGALARDLIETKLRLGRLLYEMGHADEAAVAWREALRLDPENLTIRKQIWVVEHPERFHPTIDWDWQKVQLREERKREIAEGVCGPDGCPVPAAS